MNKQPLSLAVVGHTNTGKTSLLRTLLRDSGFGEVRNAPSTTRHVEEAAISDGADMLVFLYDTPGLEDAGGVLNGWKTIRTIVQTASSGCNSFSAATARITISTKKPKCCGRFCKAIWQCTSSTRANPSSTNIGMN